MSKPHGPGDRPPPLGDNDSWVVPVNDKAADAERQRLREVLRERLDDLTQGEWDALADLSCSGVKQDSPYVIWEVTLNTIVSLLLPATAPDDGKDGD